MQNTRLLKMGLVAKAHDVAELGWLESRIGKRIVVPGLSNKVLAFLPRISPRFAVTRITSCFMGKA